MLQFENSENKEAPPAEAARWHHEEIEFLRMPLERIIRQLGERIERGEYSLIVGDDASGRIPTNTLWYFLKDVYAAHGAPSPDARFFAGAKKLSGEKLREKTRAIREHLERYRDQKKEAGADIRRALVVTDTIASGESLKPIAKALEKMKIPFDIATVGLLVERESERQDLENYLGARIFAGSSGGTPGIYDKQSLAGVTKNRQDVFARPARELWEDAEDEGEAAREVQRYINEAREDSHTLAADLYAWFKHSRSDTSKNKKTV